MASTTRWLPCPVPLAPCSGPFRPTGGWLAARSRWLVWPGHSWPTGCRPVSKHPRLNGPDRARCWRPPADRCCGWRDCSRLTAWPAGSSSRPGSPYWLGVRHGAPTRVLGPVFAAIGLLQAASFLAAPAIANQVGLLPTMVFTHLPSNLLLAAVPLAPSLPVAVGLLLVRTCLSQMDVPTRQAYVMALVPPAERTAAAAVTNTARYVTRFEVLVDAFGLGGEPALVRLARIVHAADLPGELDSDPLGPGLLAIGEGGLAVEANDQLLERGLFIYDALYAWCQHQADAQRR